MDSNAMRLPSEDQSGAYANVSGLSRLTPLPSSPLMTTSSLAGIGMLPSPMIPPKRSVANRIVLLSGDHAGSKSFAGSVVSRTKPERSMLMAQMSVGEAGESTELNATRALSGDQVG